MFKIKNPLITAAVSMALGLGMAGSAQAGPELFNTHDADGVLAITNLDWTQTSFLGQGAVGAINAFAAFASSGSACPLALCSFNVLTSAVLGSFQNPGGNVLPAPGLNLRYEVTMFSKFQERVTSVTNNGDGTVTARFATIPTGTALTEIYYDRLAPGGGSGTKATPLTGAGFNDGTLILRSTSITAATGNFTVDNNQPVSALDQAGANDYTGQLTIAGDGIQGVISIGNIVQDSTFFTNQISLLGLNFTSISQHLPFNNVDPMDCFTNTALNNTVTTSNGAYACDTNHTNGLYSAQGAPADANGYVPVTGTTNGTGTGPDFVALTDFNSGIDAVVPEPASLALMGLGLGVLGFGARRRRHPKAA